MISKLQKVLIGLGIGTGAFAVFSYFNKIKKDSAKLESSVTVNPQKVSLTETIISMDILMKNPTTTAFMIKYPHIRVTHKDFLIGSSQVIDKNIPVPAFGEAVFQKVVFTISGLKALTTGYKLVQSLLKGEALKITVETTSALVLNDRVIPYQKTEDVTLKF